MSGAEADGTARNLAGGLVCTCGHPFDAHTKWWDIACEDDPASGMGCSFCDCDNPWVEA